MITFLTVVHVLVCLFLILVVLLQAGKGGGMGIAFGGGGGSQTVFGSSGAGNFLTRLTSVTAFVFLLTSLGLAHFSSQQDSKRLQRLAERKTAEKKADDQRATKLKMDLEKAREAIQSTTGTGAAGTAPTTPVQKTEAPSPAEAATKPAETATKGEVKTAPATRHRRKHAVAAPADGTDAPAGANDSAPAQPAPDPAPSPAP